jgi:SAM-dependent methyltransferase
MVRKFVEHARSVGLLPAISSTVKQAVRHAIATASPGQDDFDLRYGTDTAGVSHLWNYKIESSNATYGVSYGSISERHIQVLLAPLPRSASFVDLGCGKGRPLLVAAAMGFHHVTGVEFVRELAEIATRNLRTLAVNGTVLCADVADYDFSPGQLIVYCYNPFASTVMTIVAEKLRRHQGELWVVYVNPRHGSLFDDWMELMPLTPSQTELFTRDSVSIWHRV